LQLVFPFLTQSVVDVGINTQNIQFVYIVLLAQLALFIGRLAYFDSKKTSTFENQQLYAIKLMRSPSFSG
jgi:ATP-binding cassette subfamily B protein